MVIKIMASSPTMKSALEYNDKKVSQGDAEVIQTANIDADGCFYIFEPDDGLVSVISSTSLSFTSLWPL